MKVQWTLHCFCRMLMMCAIATCGERHVTLPDCMTHRRTTAEAAFRADLYEMRKAVDDFEQDKGRTVRDLRELVPHYIRRIPVDPTTGRDDTWHLVRRHRDQPIEMRSGS